MIHSSQLIFLVIDLYLRTQVKNLGVKFNAHLNMSKQASNIIRSCYHMKDFRRIRRHLTKSVAITLCNALVGSNSLYSGINDKQMQRLQGVQNTLCRIVTRTHRFSSITGAYIILGAANLLVICLAFHITIDSTHPLHICPIVFSIQLHDYGTGFLRFVDVLLH